MIRLKHPLAILSLTLVLLPVTVYASLELFEFLSKPTFYLTGREPLDIASGDLNRDGFEDVVVANRTGRSISLFMGNGDGTFTDLSPLETPNGATSVAVADMNSDGHMDIVASYCSHDQGDNGIVVFYGTDNGEFEPGTSFAFEGVPYNVVVGDFNGDSLFDIAASDYPSQKVLVIQASAGGGYEQPLSLPTGLKPIALVVGDLNGDGRADLVTSDHGSGSSSVYVQGPGGEFFRRSETPTGELPYAIALGDLNGDLITDLVVAHSSAPGALSTHFGKGDGAFTARQQIEVADRLIFVGLADFDRDGDLDVITTRHQVSSAGVFLNRGNGELEIDERPIQAENKIYSLAIADFNSDGLPDLATVEFEQGIMSVALGSDPH